MSLDARARVHGCLLGGAVGDALGAAIEFWPLIEIRETYGDAGLTDYAESYGRKGAITDDTQMTLWTAEGLLRGGNNSLEEIRQAYDRWLHTQGFRPKLLPPLDGWLLEQVFLHNRRAPGGTCVRALEAGTGVNNSKGCGGVMRVAPIGLVLEQPFDLATQAAALTHGHPTGSLAAGTFAEILSRVCRGEPLPHAIRASLHVVALYDKHEETTAAIRTAVAMAMTEPPTPETIEDIGAGWIAEEALAISLFCALTANDFRSGVTLSVNHSGDSDSTGSITGNLLGAQYGIDAVPDELLDELEGRDVIAQVADDLYDAFVEKKPADRKRYPSA